MEDKLLPTRAAGDMWWTDLLLLSVAMCEGGTCLCAFLKTSCLMFLMPTENPERLCFICCENICKIRCFLFKFLFQSFSEK